MLLIGTYFFQSAINYMAANIADFENIALPPKKITTQMVLNPTLKIDATSKETWTLVDFETGQSQYVKDPTENIKLLNTIKWDLGFQRTKIITNSGATNKKGTVGVIDLGPVNFDSIREIPSQGYIKDQRRWGKVLNPALSNWYNYRTRTHNIESKRNVYILKTSRGGHAKFKILNYYCTHEESECVSVMCNRNEAACITIEYKLQRNQKMEFPPSDEPIGSTEAYQKAKLP